MTYKKNKTKSLNLFLILFLGGFFHTANAGDNNYRTLSDVLAIALPTVAAGVSYSQNDAAGLWQLAKSEAATLAIVTVLKSTIHEVRPNGSDNQSFPSGHAAVAFSAAQYMQMRGGVEFGVPAYLTAAIVSYSRVKAHEHYWKDVGAGALIGIATSYYFIDNRERFGFNIYPNSKGVYASYTTTW